MKKYKLKRRDLDSKLKELNNKDPILGDMALYMMQNGDID